MRLKYVKIGTVNYKIEYHKHIKVKEKDGTIWERIGEHEYVKGRIKVRERMNKQIESITMMHEIVHSLLCASGIFLHEEIEVENISRNLVQMILDNPKLIEYINKANK